MTLCGRKEGIVLLRTLLVWIIGLPVTLVLFLVVLLSLIIDRRGGYIHGIGTFWLRIILGLSGVKVTVRGLENIPKEGPAVLLSNHQGAFDIPALQGYIPRRFKWVAKKSLFKIPVVGWSMGLAGYISIERESAGSAYKSIESAAREIKAGTSVLIFPEGTRSVTGELLPFKRGAFILASKSGAPVVPIAIRGTKDIMKKGSLLIRPSSVVITIGAPIRSVALSESELKERARESIEALLRQ